MWRIMHHIALISKGRKGYWSQNEDDLLAWIAIGLILSSLLRPCCIHAPTNRKQEHEVANTFTFVTMMFLLPTAESYVPAATRSLFADMWAMAQAIPCSLLCILARPCVPAAIEVGMLPLLTGLSLVLGSCVEVSLPVPLLVQICWYYAGRRFF